MADDQQNSRLPPGQRLLTDPKQFPILDLGEHPHWNEESYRFKLFGLVKTPVTLSYAELLKLPQTDFTADFHCVTRWSKFDVKWSGVKWEELEKLCQPLETAKFTIQHGLDGYTTNNSLTELRKPNVFLALNLDGQAIPPEHGAPCRLIIPHLYGWKGSKFLTEIEFVAEDHPGFWEVRGYHNHGDPFTEERYS